MRGNSPDTPLYAASPTKKTYDAIVVGNGAVGLSLGLLLARKGLSVVVIGEVQRAFGASAVAGAMLGCFGEVGPSTLETPYGRAKLDLDYRARIAWPNWLETITDGSPDTRVNDLQAATGTIVIHNTVGHPEIDDQSWLAIRRAADLYKEPVEEFDPKDVAWLNPQATGRPLEAMFLPGEHAINAPLLLKVLEQAVVRAGAELLAGTVKSVRVESGRVQGVQLPNSGVTLNAPLLVLAAGVRTQQILDQTSNAARGIPRLVSGPGIAAILEQSEDTPALSSVIRTPNRAFACGLHAIPRGADRVYVGATNAIRPHPAKHASVRGLQFLLDCAVRQLRRELWLCDIQTTLVGNRPVTLDGFPLVGPSGIQGLWLLTGTYREGLHMSPILAELVSTWIADGIEPAGLGLFRPIRNPIQVMNRHDIVAQTVVHRLATGYEFDWSLPVDWFATMELLFDRFYSDLAESLDEEYTPPPDILSFIPRYPLLRGYVTQFYADCRALAGSDRLGAV